MSESEPLITCITPFLNEEQFIGEAIDSVLAQSYENCELLLVDDGSTDASTAIAQRYADSYPQKIRYFEHVNHRHLGVSASRNVGLRAARGRLIAFLDADDLWLPAKLQQQVHVLLSQPKAALTYGNTFFWQYEDSNSGKDQKGYRQDLGISPNTLVAPPKLLTLLLKNEDIHPTNCSMLVRRELFDEVGLFDEKFNMYEDTIFLAKTYLKRHVFVTSDCLAVYRLHSRSTCHVAMEIGEYAACGPNRARGEFLLWLREYLVNEEAKDANLWAVLQHELEAYPELVFPQNVIKIS